MAASHAIYEWLYIGAVVAILIWVGAASGDVESHWTAVVLEF